MNRIRRLAVITIIVKIIAPKYEIDIVYEWIILLSQLTIFIPASTVTHDGKNRKQHPKRRNDSRIVVSIFNMNRFFVKRGLYQLVE